jgi:hypothetical protein
VGAARDGRLPSPPPGAAAARQAGDGPDAPSPCRAARDAAPARPLTTLRRSGRKRPRVTSARLPPPRAACGAWSRPGKAAGEEVACRAGAMEACAAARCPRRRGVPPSARPRDRLCGCWCRARAAPAEPTGGVPGESPPDPLGFWKTKCVQRHDGVFQNHSRLRRTARLTDRPPKPPGPPPKAGGNGSKDARDGGTPRRPRDHATAARPKGRPRALRNSPPSPAGTTPRRPRASRSRKRGLAPLGQQLARHLGELRHLHELAHARLAAAAVHGV